MEQVISTATIHTSSLKSNCPYFPIHSNVPKDLFLAMATRPINSTSSSSSSSSSSTSSATTPTNYNPPQMLMNSVTGRRLRKRGEKNYSETHLQRNSIASNANTKLNNSIVSLPSEISVVGSPNKNCDNTRSTHISNNSPNTSSNDVSELQTSLTMYFNAANRIANGENFVIRGKRINADGEVQYLIEWEGVS